MLEVDIDKILPVTEARDNFNKIIDDVGGTEHMYVLTKNGKPSAVVVGVNHLEKLTGKSADELTSIVEKKADLPAGRQGGTPVVEEVMSQPTPSANRGDSLGDNVAGGSKPLETLDDSGAVPSDNRGKTDTATTGQSIQTGSATEKSSPALSGPVLSEIEGVEGPLEVPSVPTGSSDQSVGDSVGAPVSPSTSPPAAQRAPLDSGPTSSTQRVPLSSGPGSVIGPEVASNQAPAPPNQNMAASDSDLFV